VPPLRVEDLAPSCTTFRSLKQSGTLQQWDHCRKTHSIGRLHGVKEGRYAEYYAFLVEVEALDLLSETSCRNFRVVATHLSINRSAFIVAI